MSKPQNARFIRNPRKRSTNELIIVATEGAVTERDYIVALYQTFQKKQEIRSKERIMITLKMLRPNNHSSPSGRLKTLKREIATSRIDANDTAWFICDRDDWNREQFLCVQAWVDSNPAQNRWILSSPNFEYWLKLHFDSSADAKIFFDRYDKHVKPTDFSYDQIVRACKKARTLRAHASSLFEQDGTEMFLFVEFLAEKFKLEDDFK